MLANKNRRKALNVKPPSIQLFPSKRLNMAYDGASNVFNIIVSKTPPPSRSHSIQSEKFVYRFSSFSFLVDRVIKRAHETRHKIMIAFRNSGAVGAALVHRCLDVTARQIIWKYTEERKQRGNKEYDKNNQKTTLDLIRPHLKAFLIEISRNWGSMSQRPIHVNS